MKTMHIFLQVLVFMGLCANVFAQNDKKIQAQMRRLAQAADGFYTNKSQADTATSKLLKEQEIRCVDIWQSNAEQETWHYMGWFQPLYEEALAERIFNITHREDTILVRFYLIPNATSYIGEWRDPKAFDCLNEKELTYDCECRVEANEDGGFHLIPYGKPCGKSGSLGRYAYSTYDIVVNKDKIIMYNIFYDANMKELFRYAYGNHFELITKNRYYYRQYIDEAKLAN